MSETAEIATTNHHDEVDSAGRIACRLCGAFTHVMQAHLEKEHKDVSLADYKQRFPESPLLSERAMEVARQKSKERRAEHEAEERLKTSTQVVAFAGAFTSTTEPLHKLFKLGNVKAAKGHKGNDIPITVAQPPPHLQSYVPDQDGNYIFNIDLLKTVLLGIEARIPTYLWGHSGTGKTTVFEQVAAHTRRPMLRVQHTRDTESAHILGQWIVRDGATVFELGPLAYCMKHGLAYLADEYDFAMPAILAVYQPVLEGKALLIKEADEHNRVIRPHPMFRFWATGNTNGTGDETGLYQGTMIQNAANYERFGIVEEVRYMDPKVEIGVIAGQGGITPDDAENLVKFATMVRESFAAGKIGLPVSPRALINAALSGRRLGSLRRGLDLAYINRLSRVDQEAAREVLNRMAAF